ncbi:prion-inhibition and propagation-domain-containing protein [Echria macrotheca]|uniref:Prion-inhibition and propagation-domain-containing protein n=1 Tax=Echria macrotheca TaxID=438768 RepID=A0AAJ0F6I5_9PEZI|nr:prion-inhibition and propagation-domain-containing protein [Echria macrotheca]
MEPISTAMGVVSLVYDVYDNTIRIFKFLSALVDMPKACEKYRLQLIIEYNRVLAFGKAAGLIDIGDGSSLATALGSSATELAAILARIQWLLSEFRDINARYGNQLNPLSSSEVFKTSGEASEVSEKARGKDTKAPQKGSKTNEKEEKYTDANEKGSDVDIVKQISSLAVSYEKKKSHEPRWTQIRGFLERAGHNTKDVLTHPSRVRWLAVDEDTFKELLQDLHVLTERLHELMRDHRERKIDDITAKTYREMVLTRNNVDDLRAMMDAVGDLITTSANTRKEKDAHWNDRTLRDLVQLKKISRTSDSILALLANDKNLNVAQSIADAGGVLVRRYTADRFVKHFQWNDEDDLDRPRGILKTREGDIPVWIEWKMMGDVAENSPKDKEMALRTAALAEMLHMQKPASLHTPDCIGYFDDREISFREQYGWIFKMPESSDYDTQVVSLYDLLGIESRKPSLSQRVAIASKMCSTVLNLHAVNWLHKGIFSKNVIFHFNGTEFDDDGNITNLGTYDPEKPILSGFEFSRPDGSKTTAREASPMWNLYRWPGIQQEAPTERNSRKTYDLYSLGVLLLEIAHWKPLDELLKLERDSRGEVSITYAKHVRDWLLGIRDGRPNPTVELRNIAGDRYWRAVMRCLWAHGERGFGVEEGEDQSNDSRVGIRLQEAFTVHVVEELEGIHI